MTTNEFVEFLLHMKREEKKPKTKDKDPIVEMAQLVSGSFVFPLYGTLWQYHFGMDAITNHLESLHDSENHYGLVYFIIILADAAGYTLPRSFYEMTAIDEHVPILSSAIIEDWLDYDATSEVVEIEY